MSTVRQTGRSLAPHLKAQSEQSDCQPPRPNVAMMTTRDTNMGTKDNILRVVQCNLHRGKAATATLCRHLDMMRNTIALIQEPWTVNSKIAGFGSLSGNILPEKWEGN